MRRVLPHRERMEKLAHLCKRELSSTPYTFAVLIYTKAKASHVAQTRVRVECCVYDEMFARISVEQLCSTHHASLQVNWMPPEANKNTEQS